MFHLVFDCKGTAISALPQSHIRGICIPHLWYLHKAGEVANGFVGERYSK